MDTRDVASESQSGPPAPMLPGVAGDERIAPEVVAQVESAQAETLFYLDRLAESVEFLPLFERYHARRAVCGARDRVLAVMGGGGW